MIVIAGGTGRLGRILVERLAKSGERVRVLSRHPEKATALAGPALDSGLVEIVTTDVRDRDAVERNLAGARVVISAMSAFGMKNVAPREVDLAGNEALVHAAGKHDIERFILVSALGAAEQHPLPLARFKYRAEQTLIQSKTPWVILRPATFIETFQEILCAPLLDKGATAVFGHADRPINFVSVHDVASFVERALTDATMLSTITDLGGPENVSLLQFVEAFSSALSVTGSVKHIPRFALRALSQLARPFNPTFARMARAALIMDTTDMTFDAHALVSRFPEIPLTSIAAAARRDYAHRARSPS